MRQALIDLEESKIREVANAGTQSRLADAPELLKFWFGEGDEITPAAIRQAAIQSIEQGETFYAHNMGLPELREGVANYMSRLHGPGLADAPGQVVLPERVAITTGGVSALMLAMQALVNPADEVVAVTPVWPNLTGQPLVMGAKVTCVPLVPTHGAWRLDLPTLLGAVTDRTKVLILNAPNNPTGWCLSRAEQQTIAAHCRTTGTWIVADEVYERLYFLPTERACAPSFLDICHPTDRLVVVHSFSKSFLMTGWRLGFMVMPTDLAQQMGKLIEFNTSCVSVFTQRAGIAALRCEADITPRVVAHLAHCQDVLVAALQTVPGVQVQAASGGMYAFFRLDRFDDSLALAKRLVIEAGLGLAPGNAFAPQAQGWLRWCFASQDTSRLVRGVQRLHDWLSAQPGQARHQGIL